ncbi:hypothetical protein CBR_g42080 [Chara braunii]|uniref:Uncharacterized protein n=1 Tax=Chara braunii TaxID=69332 RepID=A0A388LWU4_CHABU|nr:hypothetical protein CBR_g42080 [Chara braunii]|eukprot:GBG86797.1 hypothetical protein CBR_g42080 [Chara braunii]
MTVAYGLVSSASTTTRDSPATSESTVRSQDFGNDSGGLISLPTSLGIATLAKFADEANPAIATPTGHEKKKKTNELRCRSGGGRKGRKEGRREEGGGQAENGRRKKGGRTERGKREGEARVEGGMEEAGGQAEFGRRKEGEGGEIGAGRKEEQAGIRRGSGGEKEGEGERKGREEGRTAWCKADMDTVFGWTPVEPMGPMCPPSLDHTIGVITRRSSSISAAAAASFGVHAQPDCGGDAGEATEHPWHFSPFVHPLPAPSSLPPSYSTLSTSGLESVDLDSGEGVAVSRKAGHLAAACS